MTIDDLKTGIKSKLANRQDLDADIPRWIREAVLELTGGDYPFEELRTKGPLSTLTAGVYEYDGTNFTVGGEKLTQIVTIILFNGTIKTTLKYREPQVVEQMSSTTGLPAVWSRIGNGGSGFIVAPVPNQDYLFQLRYQRQHPFTNIQSPPITDTILMPDSWQDIIEYAAAQRGAIDKRMLDYAANFHNILYGDPTFRSSNGQKGTPGLIFKRTSQSERDSSNNERQLRPVVQRYGRR